MLGTHKAWVDNPLPAASRRLNHDENPQSTVNARLPSGGACALTFCNETIGNRSFDHCNWRNCIRFESTGRRSFGWGC